MTDRIDPYALIPTPVYEAARLNMRAALMESLAGDRRRLLEAPRLGYLTVASVDMRGHSTAQARRILDWCGRDPRIAFVERKRHSRRGLREWALPPRLYEILRAEGVAYWEAVGYRVGEVMPRIWGQP